MQSSCAIPQQHHDHKEIYSTIWGVDINYNSYLPVIGVHEMHGRMHPNYCQITILLVVDLCSSLGYFMMTQPLPIAGKLLWLLSNYQQTHILCSSAGNWMSQKSHRQAISIRT